MLCGNDRKIGEAEALVTNFKRGVPADIFFGATKVSSYNKT
jgi:hypothetical protein